MPYDPSQLQPPMQQMQGPMPGASAPPVQFQPPAGQFPMQQGVGRPVDVTQPQMGPGQINAGAQQSAIRDQIVKAMMNQSMMKQNDGSMANAIGQLGQAGIAAMMMNRQYGGGGAAAAQPTLGNFSGGIPGGIPGQ